MLGLQVAHDGHVLVESTARDDLLPLRDRAPVLLLDGREVRCRTRLRPWRRMLGHVDALLSSAPILIRRAGRTDLIAAGSGRGRAGERAGGRPCRAVAGCVTA